MHRFIQNLIDYILSSAYTVHAIGDLTACVEMRLIDEGSVHCIGGRTQSLCWVLGVIPAGKAY